MDEQNQEIDKKEQQKAEEHDASKKALKTGAKAAANAYAGPIGGKAVDLASKTKLGDAVLNKGAQALNKNPGIGKIANAANKTGALDAADKAVDANGAAPNNNSDVKGGSSNKNSNSKTDGDNRDNKPISSKGLGNNKSENSKAVTTDDSYASKIFDFILKHKFIFISIIGGFLLLLILIIVVIAIVSSVSGTVINFFSGIVNNVIDFFTDDQQELMNEYYETLRDVQNDINRDYGICIDVNLITATLTINTSPDDLIKDSNDSTDDGEIVKNEDGTETVIPYNKMTKQVRLLANMQIMNKKYGLDKAYMESNGSYCASSASSKLVDSSTVDNFDGDWFENGLDSSNYELIASHDVSDFKAFFTKKANEERNYAYYLYYPPFKGDGTCSDSYAKDLLPKDSPEISIGDLATRENSVYYWNLVNSFIDEYYDEYLPDDEAERLIAIKKMADDIYLLYNELGPSKSCAVAYSGPSSLCPNGVTIADGEDAATFSLEEYVAGVVGAELGGNHPLEAKKAQAVAARTYVLKYTDYCTKTIPDNSSAQNFTRNYSDFDRQAANETAGEILVDSDGKIFLSEYDSWYCKGSTTCVYTKLPNKESHTVTLSSEYLSRTRGGHGRGMSQWAAVDMAASGKNYREILTFFYSEGVEVSLVLSPTVTDGGTIIQGPVNNYLANANSSIGSMNQYIYSQVIKSGVGTREGVVAAATSLVSGFYSQTGYKLPYELYPSGKYTGYGMDPSWGTNTGRTDYPVNGLDCSGFISWAIHNGGYSYVTKSANGWGNAGTKRSWSKGSTDSNAKPGDLIFNEPASNNGTTGHIRMIIGVNSDGYVVAEASSRKNGVRITNVSFTSTGSYYLVDMSNYYATATKVTDYPS